ncbi:outer membrane protein [Flavimaricola marinus]|uniref:Outer membrane protein beta-barrel domain-containing protein n=1 Tax=Flavimaricola marinus TaxID=1819565 RepID=A0A238LD26_9RHOB|nr:porin family protein [Flavimaricola marinus]SMY07627.1 hypothetical protein LOM8899_01764 [Flavimaricola marinus]
MTNARTHKTLRTTALTGAAVALLASPLAAGGLAEPTPEPTIAPVMVTPAPQPVDWTGFYGGASIGYGDVTGSSTIGDEMNGLTYGVHAGYMYDLGAAVLGAELEFMGSEITDDGISLDLDSVARAKLRAGYDAGAFLPYVTGGYAQLSTGGAIDDSGDGYFYGAGVDYRVSDSVLVGAEVLQHEFEDYAGSGIDVSATTFGARVSYQF